MKSSSDNQPVSCLVSLPEMGTTGASLVETQGLATVSWKMWGGLAVQAGQKVARL